MAKQQSSCAMAERVDRSAQFAHACAKDLHVQSVEVFTCLIDCVASTKQQESTKWMKKSLALCLSSRGGASSAVIDM